MKNDKRKLKEPREYITLREDVIKVLSEKEIKTTTVKAKLIELNKEKYENIHPDWLKIILGRMLEDGEIAGGKDEETGIYLWKKKRGAKE